MNLQWDELDFEHHGKMGNLAHAMLAEPWRFTPTESKVAVLGAYGFDSWRTAEVLRIDYHTVENHRSHIRHKCNAKRSEPFETLFASLMKP
jgi:DNA-binding CsgD family transcriptional regulator